MPRDRKSTRLNSSHTVIYTLSLHDALPIFKPDHPVLPVITDRWSPYVFEPRPIEREKLLSCLEAARWAPSSYNEQPWTFILAERNNAADFNRMLECLEIGRAHV